MRNNRFLIFSGLVAVVFCAALIFNVSNAKADDSSFKISANVNFGINNCELGDEEVSCQFYIKPEDFIIIDECSGSITRQILQIDIDPKDNYGMSKATDLYLGYWQNCNDSKLQDKRILNYDVSIDKNKLKSKEIVGDVTTVEYTGQFCFDVDIHWREDGSNWVTHGKVDNYCGDIKVTEKKPSGFSGKSTVGGVTTGWVNAITSKTAVINNCVVSGCKIKFTHSLRRNAGYGTTNYKITRTSNYSKMGVDGRELKSGTEKFSGGNEIDEYSETVTLVPGQVVCEEMRFRINSNDESRATTVCAMALGEVSTSIDQMVANNSVEKYKEMQKDIFAKPGDELTYKTIYDPVLQYAYYLSPQKIKINDGGVLNPYPLASIFGSVFNYYKGDSFGYWHNSFSVSGPNIGLFKDYYGGEDFYEDYIGDTTRREELNEYKVASNDVGRSLDVSAETNLNDNTKTTLSKIIFSSYKEDGKYYNLGNAKTAKISSIASVKVPFNFSNQTKIASVDGVVYAGEKANIAYEIITSPKQSIYFDDSYATVVKKAKWKVEICYGENYGNCYWSDEKEGTLHDGKGIHDESVKSDDSTSTIENIPDVPAGTKVRVRSAVYPAASSDEWDGWDDVNGNYTWAYSEPVELMVAKKPSFQVWGGSVYSAGEIDIPIANKTNLAGYGEVAYTFGSWTELGLVADGLVKGLASGAGLGYARNDGGELWPNYTFMSNGVTTNYVGDGNNNYVSNTNLPGGSEGEDFCRMSTLSFANVDCINGSVGNLNKESLSSSANSNKSALIAKFNDTESAEYTLEQHNEILDSYNIGAMEITKGETKIITVQNGTAKINGNIKYANDSYTTMAEIPKLIIYAKNIEIDCAVERIDAVLIADGSVNTCNSGDVNLQQNSTQLKINGSVVSDTIDLNRTYGAATGANSIIPAEIVNYDTSLYLWANQRSDITRTGKIMTAYQHELSPRY
ncbi:hypothetical protein IIY68_04380 [Candidatus Saccharibacteria bacterium]|nr:hypothetical protein [Candidatus Saccharibacteria bacterium]